MLRGLLKYNRLGNRQELSVFLFDLLTETYQSVDALKGYSQSRFYTVGRSFDSIFALCHYCSLVVINENRVMVNTANFPRGQLNQLSYFEQPHFYLSLFTALRRDEKLVDFINENSIKYSAKFKRYYILDDKVPFKFFPLRNLLLSTGFWERGSDISSNLWVKEEFNDFVQDHILSYLTLDGGAHRRTLDQLKRQQELQEKLGEEAEDFVLGYEQRRLASHTGVQRIRVISENWVSAGYDIESFENDDSIFYDRFIEVKSYSGSVSFYWSRNEIDVAQSLSDKYFLYLVDRSKIKDEGYAPKIIVDPYTKIYSSELWTMEAESWKVTI